MKVLSGSDVDFTWKFRFLQPKMIIAVSWYFIESKDNWINEMKLIQLMVNNSEANGGNPVLNSDRRNRAGCSFRFQNQIWWMSCRLTNTKAQDIAPYGAKIRFQAGKDIVASNTSFLEVVGKFLANFADANSIHA